MDTPTTCAGVNEPRDSEAAGRFVSEKRSGEREDAVRPGAAPALLGEKKLAQCDAP